MGRLIAIAAMSLLLGVQIPSALAESPQRPIIRVVPDSVLIDEPVAIQVTGLTPGQTATIRANTTDAHGRDWRSFASFEADQSGRVTVAAQRPISGTYTCLDGMGLLWSLSLAHSLPKEEREDSLFHGDIDKPSVTKFELEVNRQSVAACELTRYFKAPDVEKQTVREGGLLGELYIPSGRAPHPALLVLSGSRGGTDRATAALLASHGYTAFALAYFRVDGLPDKLINIPLDNVKQGLDWMGQHESVDARRIAVIGSSKGGELALLLGAMFPEIRAVVAYAPSHVVWEGISGDPVPVNASSWMYNGEGLDYVPYKNTPAFYMQFRTGEPVRLVELYRPSLENQEAVARAAIPVEKINGSVLLISGRADQMWPSAPMAESVMERLKEYKHPHPYTHLCYEDAGHAIHKGYLPATNSVAGWALGGTAEANAKAQADSWPRVLRFLEHSLR